MFLLLFNVPLLWSGRYSPDQCRPSQVPGMYTQHMQAFTPTPPPSISGFLSQQPPDLCPMPQPGTKRSVLSLQKIGSHMLGHIQCECGWVRDWALPRCLYQTCHGPAVCGPALKRSPILTFPVIRKLSSLLGVFRAKGHNGAKGLEKKGFITCRK